MSGNNGEPLARLAAELGAQHLPTCYGFGRPPQAEYDRLKKTAAESKVALGKVAAVQV
jgi:hypothetical protein